MKIGTAVEEYLASKKRMNPRALKDHEQFFCVFVQWCEEQHLSLEDIRARQVDQFIAYMEETRTPKKKGRSKISTHTLNKYMDFIKGFLLWCADDEEFGEHVKLQTVRKIHSVKTESYVKETFSKEQINAIFAACEREESNFLRDRDRTIVAVLLDTGIRAAELCSLTIGAVELSPRDPHIRVFGKGSKWREIGLGEKSRRELRKYITKYRADKGGDAPVFINRYHQPLTVDGLTKMVKRVCEWAGIEGMQCSPHIFRHTFSVMYIRQGGDVYRLSKLLGHVNLSITEHYLKSFSQEDARRGSLSPLDDL